MNTRKVYIVCTAISLSCLVHASLYGQKVSAKANRTRIFIGEQIIVKLMVDDAHLGTDWFRFADTFNHFEILTRSKIDTVKNGAYTNYSQTIAVTSFDSGNWQFPTLAIAGIHQATLPINIDVVPADVSQKKDYNDIKDIEEIVIGTNPILIGIIASIALFSLCMVWLLISKRKHLSMSTPVLKGNQSPWQWAEQELNKLRQPDPYSALETKQYYAMLNIISRTFFTLQLKEKNIQLTTGEWMVNLNKIQGDGAIKNAFFKFLRLGDSVRFAKYLPPSYENQNAVATVGQMLQNVSLLQENFHSNSQPHQR